MFIEICFYTYVFSAIFQLLWLTYKMKSIERRKEKIKKMMSEEYNTTFTSGIFDVIIVVISLCRILIPIHNTLKCIKAIGVITNKK